MAVSFGDHVFVVEVSKHKRTTPTTLNRSKLCGFVSNITENCTDKLWVKLINNIVMDPIEEEVFPAKEFSKCCDADMTEDGMCMVCGADGRVDKRVEY
jgi:hypothetical protein